MKRSPFQRLRVFLPKNTDRLWNCQSETERGGFVIATLPDAQVLESGLSCFHTFACDNVLRSGSNYEPHVAMD